MSNEGWVFGPMAVAAAGAIGEALQAEIVTTNAHPATALGSATAYTSYVSRVGGEGTLSGYAGFYDSSDYPDALPNIWAEGTGEAALAFSRTGDHSRWVQAHTWLDALQELDGSLRYVEVDDDTYNLHTLRSVIGASWYVLAHLEGGIWGDPVGPFCMRNIV